MMSDEQIRLSERRHFLGNARGLAQSTATQSRPLPSRPGQYRERDASLLAIGLAFVVPGVILGAWAARLHWTQPDTKLMTMLNQYRLMLPHSQYEAVETIRGQLLDVPAWSLLATLSVTLIVACPLINILCTIGRRLGPGQAAEG